MDGTAHIEFQSRPAGGLKRRERVARELRELFEDHRVEVSEGGAYRHEKLNEWGWNTISERLIELIDRGKLA